MDIRIKTIRLQNFKGVKDASFDFGCGNATVYGENGTGKSTIFDAFTWLLFGKDHAGRDQTQFDIKTIDPASRTPIPKLDHSVEATLTVDGCEKTLQRIWRENWVKPKGEAEAVMKGHVSIFLVDGVDVGTKASYDGIIHQWIDEDVFKLITNPLFLIDDNYTHWKTRRETVLNLVDGSVDRSAVLEQFGDLLKEMNGESLDMFKRRIAALKKDNKRLLAECEPKIKAYNEAMPAPVNLAKAQSDLDAVKSDRDAQIERIKERKAALEGQMDDVCKANETRDAEISDLYARISMLRAKQRDFTAEGLKDAQRRENERINGVLIADQKVRDAKMKLEQAKRDHEKAMQAVQEMNDERADLGAKLRDLGKRHDEAKAKVFEYTPTTICPACGQALPADTVEAATEQAREKFMAFQKSEMTLIVDKARNIKEDIRIIDDNIASRTRACGQAAQLVEEAERLLQVADQEDAAAHGVPTVNMMLAEAELRKEPEFVALSKQIQELNAAALDLSAKTVSVADIRTQLKALNAESEAVLLEAEAKSRPIRMAIAQEDERSRIKGLIADTEKREKDLAGEIARLERLEYEAAAFVKADIDAQEEAINGLFRVARWKMFDTTLDGGIVETCEVTSSDGVPFRSMNDARKIQCGMDVIRVLGDRYGALAPIFIDNAESITQRSFDTQAQVIRLCVREGAALNVEL